MYIIMQCSNGYSRFGCLAHSVRRGEVPGGRVQLRGQSDRRPRQKDLDHHPVPLLLPRHRAGRELQVRPLRSLLRTPRRRGQCRSFSINLTYQIPGFPSHTKTGQSYSAIILTV